MTPRIAPTGGLYGGHALGARCAGGVVYWGERVQGERVECPDDPRTSRLFEGPPAGLGPGPVEPLGA